MQRTTLYISGESGLHALHPLTKLALTGFFLALAAVLPDIFFLILAYILILLPLAAWGRILGPYLRGTLTVVLPFAISLAVIQGFFSGGDIVLFELGRFSYTLEGLIKGETVAARILLAMGGAFLLMLSTRPDHLMLALSQRGLPNSLAYIVLTALQIFPRFQDQARIILEAQQSRGLETKVNPLKRLGLLVPLSGPLILSSILDVEERAMALEARAFSRRGPRTSLIELHDNLAQKLLRGLIVLAIFVLIITKIWTLLAS
jgi:energy-coupling factor transport system permease protein